MVYSGRYNGCKVIVRAEKDERLSIETTIVEYNSTKLVLVVNGALPEVKENEKVFLLLLLDNSVLEYQGIVRKVSNSGNREITLFKGREKEEREDMRYRLNVNGIVEGLLVGDHMVLLGSEPEALVINISKGGILVKMRSGVLNRGTGFRIRIIIGGVDTRLNAKVMRTRIVEDTVEGQMVEYGCILTGKL